MDRPVVRICHLYPDMMNIYGDRGNIIALGQRARWHGLEPELSSISLGEQADFGEYDILAIGGGQDREQRLICQDFAQVKGTSLADAVQDGVALLAVCGGYQLTGRYYQTGDGEVLPGLGIFDVWTEASQDRMIGNVVIETDLSGTPQTVVGFENHSGKTFHGAGARPLGKVLKGYGNNGRDGHEGVVHKNSIGTYLHGSVLPKNPVLADWLLQRALDRRYGAGQVTLRPLDDELEQRAHDSAVKRAR